MARKRKRQERRVVIAALEIEYMDGTKEVMEVYKPRHSSRKKSAGGR